MLMLKKKISSGRLQELDSLRGIAAVLVMLFHYIYHYDSIYGHEFEIHSALRFCRYFVELFFMISGFVIYWSITRAQSMTSFSILRFIRLYPTYWVCLLITYLFVTLVGLPGREVSGTDAAMNVMMFHSYLGVPHVDGVYWSLAIELMFYALIVFAWMVFGESMMARFQYIWLASVIIFTYASQIIDIPFEYRLQQVLIIKYAAFFIAGMSFYRCWRDGYSVRDGVLIVISLFMVWQSYPMSLALFISSFFLVFILMINGWLGFLSNKVLLWFGAVSYPLYLIHQNIGYAIINYIASVFGSTALGIVAAMVVSITIAAVVHYSVELRLTRALKGLYKKHKYSVAKT